MPLQGRLGYREPHLGRGLTEHRSQTLHPLPSLPGRALVPVTASPLTSSCPREQSFSQGPQRVLGGSPGSSLSRMLNAPNSLHPLHVFMPLPVLCPLPKMPLPPLPTLQTFVLRTNSGNFNSKRLSLTPPPIMLTASSPGPPLPSQSPPPALGSWFTCQVPIQAGQKSPGQGRAKPWLAPGQEPCQGSSYLGEDLVHVSGSQ